MDFTKMSAEEFATALSEARAEAIKFSKMETATVEQVDEFEQVMASLREMEAEEARRETVAKEASDKFAALKASLEPVEEETPEEEVEPEEEPEPEVEVEVEAEDTGDGEIVEAAPKKKDDEEKDKPFASDASRSQVVTASARKTSVAKRVAAKAPRPSAPSNPGVIMTAAASPTGKFVGGQRLNGMGEVADSVLDRVKSFPRFNAIAAQRAHEVSGGEMSLQKVNAAQFEVPFSDAHLSRDPSTDYSTIKASLADHNESLESLMSGKAATLAAAGWCAPSETVYSYVADYVVDGLVSVPEVGAPRGGLNLTTGPARSTQGTALDDFGFVQTEAQAEAGTVKPCETIECPDFVDHRLDAIGYCIKIPLLTQHAYPELITDALRLADVLYAHKVNRRVINDLVALSTAQTATGIGAVVTDTLEALSIIAMRERRKWNIGRNAIMEVKLPEVALEIFRADMSRRTGLALSDVANEQKIAAEFAARRLAVEYVSDWQEVSATAVTFPATIQALIYPAGTFIKATENVINLSAVYDAASLSVNEYTGVFFEQGILTAKAAYGSTRVTIPVCSAGMTGAAALDCVAPTP